MIDCIDFLGEAEFTKRDEKVQEALREALFLRERDSLYGKISFYLVDVLKNEEADLKLFRKRTASEIIVSGVIKGCSEAGLVFCAMAREASIPTKYVETFKLRRLTNPSFRIEGHVFVDLFLDKNWISYEPKKGFIQRQGYWLKEEEYFPVARGLDFSQLFLISGHSYEPLPVRLDSIDELRGLWNSFTLNKKVE